MKARVDEFVQLAFVIIESGGAWRESDVLEITVC
jgi:hypothetical protein